MIHWRRGTILGLVLALSACTSFEGEPEPDAAVEAGTWQDAGKLCADPAGDYDSDGIPNGEEGCLTGRDSDGDKVPDWQDLDSDNDKVPDSVEAGERTGQGRCKGAPAGRDHWPCDTDGDKYPDYLDRDSDGDGLDDGQEDLNGDGLLGCCLSACKQPGSVAQKKCALTKDGCGSGQKCSSGKCVPAVSFLCSEGETSARKKDTFGDGVMDSKRGTYICRDATEHSPGRKPVLLKQDKPGDWNLALDQAARYGKLSVAGAGAKVAAAAIDFEKSGDEVAGFVISRGSTTGIQSELTSLLNAIAASPPGGAGGKVTVLASGTQGKSHDKYDAVTGTYLRVEPPSSSDVSSVRNDLVAALLGKSPGDLGNLPSSFGGSSSAFIVRFTTVKRFAFKKDAGGKLVLDSKGYPTDSGDRSQWRLLVIGAVAAATEYKDPTRRTGVLVDDLSNGTSLALASDTVGNQCDARTISSKPVADIVWVSDESGSMNDNRDDVTAVATDFFKRAVSMGLDFRMGITNVVPRGRTGFGKFCSRISSNRNDSGGTDRFLLPSEQSIFTSCIHNPPGYTGGHAPGEYGLINARAAVEGHLPAATGDISRFRKNASIFIVVLTDQIAAAVETAVGYQNSYKCTLDSSTQAGVNQLLQPFVDYFSGKLDPEATVSGFLVIGGVCNNPCRAMIAHGYKELVNIFGGQIGDVCQKKMGSTMQTFLDSIVASASPVTLGYVPISTSLAVTVDGKEIKRSRYSGFDYSSANNSLVFINVKYDKGSRIFASYKRWERQATIK